MSSELAKRSYGIHRFIYRLISNIISRSCLISSHWRAKIFRHLGVDICKNVFIGQHVYFDELAPNRIHIGSGAKITRGVTLLSHFIDSATGSFVLGDIYVGENSFIGLNSIITKPVKIGKNCIIGAGSVITKDIPDNSVAAGNPCKVIHIRWGQANMNNMGGGYE